MLIDKSKIELEILREIFAELETRDLEIEITIKRNSPAFPEISFEKNIPNVPKIKKVTTAITAGIESWTTTHAVSDALVELDQESLNSYEFLGLFLINAAAYASIDLVFDDIIKEDSFLKSTVDELLGSIDDLDFVLDLDSLFLIT